MTKTRITSVSALNNAMTDESVNYFNFESSHQGGIFNGLNGDLFTKEIALNLKGALETILKIEVYCNIHLYAHS